MKREEKDEKKTPNEAEIPKSETGAGEIPDRFEETDEAVDETEVLPLSADFSSLRKLRHPSRRHMLAEYAAVPA